MIRRGLGRVDAAIELQEALIAELGLDASAPFAPSSLLSIPPGWKGTVAEYFQGLASNTTTVARISGSVREFARAKVDRYEWVATGDDRMCDVCAWMDGRIFGVDGAVDQIDALANAKSPQDTKAIQPWGTLNSIFQRSGLSQNSPRSSGSSKALQGAGCGLPPIHYLCRCTVDIAEDAVLGDLNYEEVGVGEE
jgi:hypothetical protein